MFNRSHDSPSSLRDANGRTAHAFAFSFHNIRVSKSTTQLRCVQANVIKVKAIPQSFILKLNVCCIHEIIRGVNSILLFYTPLNQTRF